MLRASILAAGVWLGFLVASWVGRRFGILHGAYAMADLVKAAALAGLELLLLRRP